MNKFFIPLLLAFSCLTACKPEIPTAGGELEGLYHTWTLVAVEQDNKWESVPSDLNDMTMELNAISQASLHSSCNQGGGDFDAKPEGSIDFFTSIWTEAYCGQVGDQWERIYIEGLDAVDQFSLADNELWLWNDDLSLRFER